MNRRDALLASSLPLLPGPLRAQAAVPTEAALVARLREGGAVLLMRHALTDPGIGDPPDFRLGDCARASATSAPKGARRRSASARGTARAA